MNQTKVFLQSEKKVKCDGGDVEKGHPAIYLDLSDGLEIKCPYCSKIYKYVGSNEK